MLDYCAVGRRIKAFREQKGITQEVIAEAIDISLSHISRIENGHTKPSLEVLVQIANVLDVSIDALLCDSLIQSQIIFQSELSKLLEGCSSKELKMIVEIAKVSLYNAREAYKC